MDIMIWQRKSEKIWENYPADSVTSGDAGNKDFVGWSGIGSILFLLEYGIGLQESKDGLKWDISEAVKDGKLGCRNYWFGGKKGDFLAEIRDHVLHITINTEDKFPAEIQYEGKTYSIFVSGKTEMDLK